MKSLLKKLDKILELLTQEAEERKAEREEKQRAENEQRLIDYAKAHGKRLPSLPSTSNDYANRPVHSDGDLVPYNLTEKQKAILQLFYDS